LSLKKAFLEMDLIGKSIDYRFRHEIPQVREVFMERLKKQEDHDDLYDEDISKIMTNDYWVEKYLEWNKGNIDKTVDGLLFAAKYMKKYRLREIMLNQFAAEVYMVGGIFKYEPDRLGRPTLYTRMKYCPSCKETRDMSLQFGSFIHLLMEENSGENGYICVNDFGDMSLSNVDLKLTRDCMELLHIFPYSAKLVVCVNVPTPVRYFINAFKGLLPVEQRTGLLIITKEQLPQVIPIENIPDFLGGKCRKPYSGQEMIPEGCLPAREAFKQFLKRNDENDQKSPILVRMDEKTMLRVVDYYEKLMNVSVPVLPSIEA